MHFRSRLRDQRQSRLGAVFLTICSIASCWDTADTGRGDTSSPALFYFLSCFKATRSQLIDPTKISIARSCRPPCRDFPPGFR